MSSHMTLAAASDDRKARLAKLKSLKRKQPSEDQEPSLSEPTAPAPEPADEDTTTAHQKADDTSEHNNTTAAASPPARASPHPPTQDVARLHLSGRNYDFETKGPKLGFEAPPTLGLDRPTLEQRAAELERAAKESSAGGPGAQDATTIDVHTLRPNKPNWDLKRDLDQKMAVLNVRTENAIARLVRERLAEKKKSAEAARKAAAAAEGGAAGMDGPRKPGEVEGDEEAEGMLDGAALVEGMRMREREDEEENRREREAEAAEFGMA